LVEQLSCGQTVSVIGLERGYLKIKIGERIAYVEAKYVRLPQIQKQRITQIEEQTKKPQQPSKPRRHEGGLAFDVSHREYEEPNFVNQKGIMWGVSGDYAYRPNNFMFKLDGRFSFGNMKYWSTGTGTAEDIRDYNYETRFSFGYDLKASERACFTPFAGLGYRYLFDGFGGITTSTGARGYDRKSNYLYSPIGMETMFRLKGGWSLGFVGEYDLFWHGWQYSEIGDFTVVPYYLVLPNYVAKNDQDSGWGARGSIKLIKNLGRVDFAIEPYFRYWNIKNSDSFELLIPNYLLFTLIEPANITKEWGTKLGIRF
jgi:hypothetical protein